MSRAARRGRAARHAAWFGAAAFAVLALAVGWFLRVQGPASAAVAAVVDSAGEADSPAAFTRPLDDEGAARPLRLREGVVAEPGEAASVELALALNAGRAALGLLARLEEVEQRAPETFHDEAGAVLRAFAAEHPALDATAFASSLQGELAQRVLSVPVRGAALAALAALGDAEQALPHVGENSEARRSISQGLVWSAGRFVPEGVVQLSPREYFRLQPRPGLAALDLPCDALPAAASEAWLWGTALARAETFEALLGRELAIFALGTGVDLRPDWLEAFRQLLFDPDPSSRMLRPALCYVLTHASSPQARALVLAYLKDGQAGSEGKVLARWWLADQAPGAGELEVLAAPLLDERSRPHERIIAAGSLLGRIATASPDERAAMEELLALRVLRETEETARIAALSVLEELTTGGLNRLAALEHVLRHEGAPPLRITAARALGRTEPPRRSEALAVLRALLAAEQDETVRAAIEQALAETG